MSVDREELAARIEALATAGEECLLVSEEWEEIISALRNQYGPGSLPLRTESDFAETT